jgi:hypothetical protein
MEWLCLHENISCRRLGVITEVFASVSPHCLYMLGHNKELLNSKKWSLSKWPNHIVLLFFKKKSHFLPQLLSIKSSKHNLEKSLVIYVMNTNHCFNFFPCFWPLRVFLAEFILYLKPIFYHNLADFCLLSINTGKVTSLDEEPGGRRNTVICQWETH